MNQHEKSNLFGKI